MADAARASDIGPILIDRYLQDAVEVDIDVIADGETVRDRRGDGACRGGGHPFRRQRLLAAALLAAARDRGARSSGRPRRWRGRSRCAA